MGDRQESLSGMCKSTNKKIALRDLTLVLKQSFNLRPPIGVKGEGLKNFAVVEDESFCSFCFEMIKKRSSLLSHKQIHWLIAN